MTEQPFISPPFQNVALGLLLRQDGKLLLGERPVGKPLAGHWELPGGKLAPGETPYAALVRELQEELGIHITRATPWVIYPYTYPHMTVRLACYRITDWIGEPQGQENQRLAWIDPQQEISANKKLLPAARLPLRWLQLPSVYGISNIGTPQRLPTFLQRLDLALARGVRLIQFREPHWPDGPHAPTLWTVMTQILNRCHAVGAKLLVNSAHPATWWQHADGVHLREADARQHATRPLLAAHHWVGMSLHHREQLPHVHQLNPDFVVVGPVAKTATHPGQPGMGWLAFREIIQDVGRPAYSLGGQSLETLAQAQAQGAQGIAAIRAIF